jgi:bacteriorhodopsin
MNIDTTTTYILWLGFTGMSIGTLMILSYWRKFKPEHRYHVILALMVTTIAAAAYYAMASGQGALEFNGKTVYFARYIDWVLTTPLLLLSLITVALPNPPEAKLSRSRLGLISAILFADIAMITTGAIANFSTQAQDIVVWYVASCLWFVVVIYLLFVDVWKEAKLYGAQVSKAYISLLLFLSSIWLFYPVVWLLGESGFSMISMNNETAIYAVLDVTAKAVFGVVLLSTVLKIKGSNLAK